MKTISEIVWGQDVDETVEISQLNNVGLSMSCGGNTQVRCRSCHTMVIAGRRCPNCNFQM